jgi:hypothetical protein
MFESKKKGQEARQDPKEALHNSQATEAQRMGPKNAGETGNKSAHEYKLNEHSMAKGSDQFRQDYLASNRLKQA